MGLCWLYKYRSDNGAVVALKKTYYWGIDFGGGEGTGGMLSEFDGIESLFTQMDGNGNVVQYINTTGTVAAHFEYDSFGQTLVKEGVSKNLVEYGFS